MKKADLGDYIPSASEVQFFNKNWKDIMTPLCLRVRAPKLASVFCSLGVGSVEPTAC